MCLFLQVNISNILRVSYVYLTYILRVSYVFFTYIVRGQMVGDQYRGIEEEFERGQTLSYYFAEDELPEWDEWQK